MSESILPSGCLVRVLQLLCEQYPRVLNVLSSVWNDELSKTPVELPAKLLCTSLHTSLAPRPWKSVMSGTEACITTDLLAPVAAPQTSFARFSAYELIVRNPNEIISVSWSTGWKISAE